MAARQAGGYTSADLFGTWALHGLATGEESPWWSRGTITVEVGGGFSGTIRGSDGSQTPTSGTFFVSADGIVTSTENSTFQCGMDAGKTVIVCTESR
jgi:hypothetical protein